jgi:hypothetical protein
MIIINTKNVVVSMASHDNELISDLKGDVDSLKRKLSKPDAKSEELILEIESLKESIHELTNIFQKAVELTKEEDLTRNINNKLDAVIKQNETIARGMVAVSDKVDEFVGGSMATPSPPRRPMQHTMGPPAAMGRVAPVPTAHTGMDDMNLPPPPPAGGKKRHGLFK